GVGISGAKRLMDRFEIRSSADEGTAVLLEKELPGTHVTPKLFAEITEELSQQRPQNPFQEVQAQNQELLRALEELQARQVELAKLNRELEETNRGVVALYAE